MQKPKVDAVYFLSFTIENVLCFGKRQEITLTDKTGRPAQWTILVGENGVGKTTVLRAFAMLAAAKPEKLLTTSGWDLTRQAGKKPSVLEAKVSGGTKLTDTHPPAESTAIHFQVDHTKGVKKAPDDVLLPKALVCFGYGVNRLMGTSGYSDKGSFQNVNTLFQEFAALGNAEAWLVQAELSAKKDKRLALNLDLVKAMLIKLLPDINGIRIAGKGQVKPVVEFEIAFGWVPVSNLSLSHQSLISWLLDLAVRMFERYPDSENPLAEPAIVLVDEIELHLHPRWQRKIIKNLSRQFPNTQFIVTTNSPLVVQAVPDANLVLLKNKGDQVVVRQDIGKIKNWRVDQILTSEFFGLKSARPSETGKLMRKRDKLLGKPDLTDIDRVTITRLDNKIGQLPYGETGAEIKADSIIKSLARKLKSEGKI
jgi:energy-coupling factor transporter ATP-binding protein EcfA2